MGAPAKGTSTVAAVAAVLSELDGTFFVCPVTFQVSRFPVFQTLFTGWMRETVLFVYAVCKSSQRPVADGNRTSPTRDSKY